MSRSISPIIPLPTERASAITFTLWISPRRTCSLSRARRATCSISVAATVSRSNKWSTPRARSPDTKSPPSNRHGEPVIHPNSWPSRARSASNSAGSPSTIRWRPSSTARGNGTKRIRKATSKAIALSWNSGPGSSFRLFSADNWPIHDPHRMKERVLVTGGAGFIGSHIVDGLVHRGYRVRVMDYLEAQVHGKRPRWPEYRNRDAEYVRGDVRDASAVSKALRGINVVYHEAAAVGVGQSLYQIEKYISVNTLGAGVVLEAILKRRADIRKMIVASSMSIYGEGKYHCGVCGTFSPRLRPRAQLRQHRWEMRCANC